VALLLQEEQPDIPRFYICVPASPRFSEIAIAFQALNLWKYPTGLLLSIQIVLQDENQRTLICDCPLDPISQRHLLQALSTASEVEMIAFADTPHFPFLGAKRLHWPTQKRHRAWELFVHTRSMRSRGKWKQACRQFFSEHPSGVSFQEPPPSPPMSALFELDTFSSSPPLAHQNQETANSSTNDLRVDKSKDLPLSRQFPPDSLIQEAQGSQMASSPSRVSSGELIERCLLMLQVEAHNEWVKAHTCTPRLFWYSLLAQAIKHTQRKLIWTHSATQLISEKQTLFTPSAMLPTVFASTHLWIQFEAPIATPICPETAALFLCVGSDTALFSQVAQQLRTSSQTLKILHRDLYQPEQHMVTLNIFNSRGSLVWTIGLDTRIQRGTNYIGNTWIAPSWYICPAHACQFSPKSSSSTTASQRQVVCPQCEAAQAFFSSWLAATWQSLRGTYREKRTETSLLETLGEVQVERRMRSELPIQDRQAVTKIEVEHHYRVVRHIDIVSTPPPRSPQDPGFQGSWLEALLSIDPDLVTFDEREIPLQTRTLRHPRYARYIEQHGTNQVEVRPHRKRVPMRTDPTAMTKITATQQHKQPPESKEGNERGISGPE
jgi:hypothetical protein